MHRGSEVIHITNRAFGAKPYQNRFLQSVRQSGHRPKSSRPAHDRVRVGCIERFPGLVLIRSRQDGLRLTAHWCMVRSPIVYARLARHDLPAAPLPKAPDPLDLRSNRRIRAIRAKSARTTSRDKAQFRAAF
ncbi:hypothetical protein TcasGA2_TC032099 [Tribolium castaneum]|uniref:Uncharacterized protein n=1 Tax=Tribolium castaneum TaxID=7070 RepID=A0A139WM84_TRICA|nr:hypothetical protein TcasGA2_TC032099 [Tribolium castaneum]